MRILGLDVGEKRIGVAKGDSKTRIAVPVGTVNVDGNEWAEIARIARVQSIELFILGLPRSNEGNETKQSLYVRDFAKKLAEQIPGAKIRFQDESLTSVIAEERLRKRKKNYEKGEIDMEAATIILQDFLESFHPEDLEKEEIGEVKLETKVKRKMKTTKKIITGVAILAILGLIGTGGALMIREKLRADWRAEQERIEQEKEEDRKRNEFSFMIRPGETIFEIKEQLLELNQGYTEKEIDEAFLADYDFDFLKGRPEGATLEGYLFGETYFFDGGTSVKEIFERFLAGMQEVIEENNLEAAYKAQGLSLYEGITLASIVQKEAPSPEQPTVAQVFLSRLQYNIALGSDVTVSYALDKVDPDRKIYADNQSALKVDSCYNTRLYRGLPCGPISNPGLSALLAVANPSNTSYLYFLTGDDGMMYYSYTPSEHEQNIYSHCKKLCGIAL